MRIAALLLRPEMRIDRALATAKRRSLELRTGTRANSKPVRECAITPLKLRICYIIYLIYLIYLMRGSVFMRDMRLVR